MLEVELKARLKNRSEVVAALLACGFQKDSEVHETDVYFNGTDRDFQQTDEALRLRRVVQGGRTHARITYKGPKRDVRLKMRTEHETAVDEYESMYALLLALGHIPVREVKKTRAIFTREGVHACVDTLEGLGDFLELERVLPGEEGKAQAVEELFALLKLLGVPHTACTDKSYLEMLLAKDACL